MRFTHDGQKGRDIVPFCTLSGFVQISGSSLEGIAGTRLELATSAVTALRG